MDGPAHYREGEVSFQKAKEAARATDGASAVLHMQAAQFHATMALTAATAATIEEYPRWKPWENLVLAEDEEGDE